METSPAILVSRPDGTVHTANDPATKLFERPLGRRCWDALSSTGCPKTLPCRSGCVAALIAKGPGANRHSQVTVRETAYALTCVAADAQVVVMLTALGAPSAAWVRLTEREKQVVGLVARGMNTRRIAEELKVSQATVRSHLEHVRVRLGVPSRAALVAAAMRSGIIR